MNKQRMQTLAGLLKESKKPLNEAKQVDIIKNGEETRITLPKKYVIVCHTSTSKLPDAEYIVGSFDSGYYCKGKEWKESVDSYSRDLLDLEDGFVTRKFEEAEIFTDKDVVLWDALFYMDDLDKEYFFGEFFEPLEVEVKEQSVINVRMKKTGEKYSKTLINGKLVK